MESGYRELQKNPRQNANLISIFFFGWAIPLVKRSYYKILHPNDTFAPLDNDRSSKLGDRLERYRAFK